MERQKEEAEIEEGGMDGKGGKREGSMKAEEGGGGEGWGWHHSRRPQLLGCQV